MKIRTCAALLLAVGLPTAVFAVDFPEIEPNETKAQALANGAFVLAAGDSVSGTTTGTSTTVAGATSADTFLIKTTPAALGIYRHRLAITTGGTAGHTGTIRGLGSTSTGATAGGDSVLQTSSSSTTPARVNQWYGFGKEEQLYYRVTGGTTTTSPYQATLTTDVVTPTAFSSNPESGSLTITHDGPTDTAYDRDMFLFDSNFNVIAGMDDPDTSAMAVTLATGTYYIGYGRWQTAAGLTAGSSIIQGTYQAGTVLDFANAVATGVATVGTQPVGIAINASNGVHTAVGSALGAFDVAWFVVNVGPSVTPTNPSGTGSANPSIVANDGTGVTTLSVTVTPGINPTSTFAGSGSVTVDGSLIGAGTVVLLDNGVAPDLVAGDLIFSGNATVANGTAGGPYSLPFNITDDQARTGNGTIALTVTTPAPGCSSGLATLSYNGVSSNGAVGNASNSIVTGDFGVAGQINQLVISGRVTAFGASYRSEARVRATSPGGGIFDFAFGLPASAGTSDVIDFPVTFAPQAGTGTWTFEFWESFDDSTNPDATWQAICFAARQVSTPITATDTASGPVVRDGVATSTLRVTVTPGAVPASSGLAVVVDDSSVGGSGTLALLDDGVGADLVAGDNIFSGTTTVAYTTSLGGAVLPYVVSDNEGRFYNDTLNFVVAEATGACCTDSGCVVTTIGDCLDVLGGTFAGTGTTCTAPTALTTDGAGAFEDISATGDILFASGDDLNSLVFLPFNFNFFGNDYTSVGVCTNGFIQFTGTSTVFTNTSIPTAGLPNDAIYGLWDDLNVTGGGTVRTQTLGTLGVDARFIIQWTNVPQFSSTDTNTFQIVLFEDGSFELRYVALGAESVAGDTTTIGLENIDGTLAYQSPETRDSLIAQLPVSLRGNSEVGDTGVCGTGCPPCAADYDNNGGVDGGDLAAFFTDFETGEACADVDGNGGIDGGDLGYFFFVFEQGGCD